MNYINSITPSQSSIIDFTVPFIVIPLVDVLLCKIFGTKSRWFQLHSVINGVIVYIIWDDVISLLANPLSNIRTIDSKIDSYFIMILHIYHAFIVERLSIMDSFHHLFFVGGGVIPSIVCYNSNLVRLAWFPTCGLPGCIEYFTLSLVKHNLISSLKQKRINAYIYNYVRFPITIYGPSLTYIAYKNGQIHDNNVITLIYFNLILFFNGAFYNRVTVENYALHKHLQFGRISSYHTL